MCCSIVNRACKLLTQGSVSSLGSQGAFSGLSTFPLSPYYRAQCKGCGHCRGADLPIRVWKQEGDFITQTSLVRVSNWAPFETCCTLDSKHKENWTNSDWGQTRTHGYSVSSSPFGFYFKLCCNIKRKFTRHDIAAFTKGRSIYFRSDLHVPTGRAVACALPYSCFIDVIIFPVGANVFDLWIVFYIFVC